MNTSTIRFKALDGISDLGFLKHWLQSFEFRSQITREVTGIAQKNFGPSHLKRLKISLPPLPEQKRIAAILDAADELRTKRRESIKLLDDLIQSTFLEMFGDPVTNPKGWKKILIGDHIKVLGGYAFKSNDFSESGYPIIRISNLKGSSVELDNCVRIPEMKLGRGKYFQLQPGDTLIAMSGATTGKLGYVPDDLDEKWYLNQRVGAFRLPKNTPLERAFVRELLRSTFYQNHVWNLAGGAAQPNISGKQLSSAEIPMPDITIQKRFANIVALIEQQKVRLQFHLNELDTLFASLQQRAFNGEL